MLENTASFSTWLKDCLLSLSCDIDADVFGEYIQGILEDEAISREDHLENVSDFLSSVLSYDLATKGSEKIVERFHDGDAGDKDVIAGRPLVDNKAPDTSLDELANQMRSLMQQKQPIKSESAAPASVLTSEKNDNDETQPAVPTLPPKKERDACTIAALRAAGVRGYQENDESEAALSVSLANAEFVAKQRMATVNVVTTVAEASNRRSKETVATLFDILPTEAEDIDIEELEDASGYGKKEGVKPMNVMDALSELNPLRFSSSKTAPTPKADLKIAATKRLPTPGDVNSSTPAYMLMASRTYRSVPISSPLVAPNGQSPNHTAANQNGAGESISKKVKAPVSTSKHLAEIGAKAEERQLKMVARKNEKLSNVPVAGRNRLDDMDAFFISDDEEEKKKPVLKSKSKTYVRAQDILMEGGGNRERIEAAQKQAREASSLAYAERRAKEKVERTKQLEAEAVRKATAQAKAVKQERKRR